MINKVLKNNGDAQRLKPPNQPLENEFTLYMNDLLIRIHLIKFLREV